MTLFVELAINLGYLELFHCIHVRDDVFPQLNVRYNVYTVPVPGNNGIKVTVETTTDGDIVTIRTCSRLTSKEFLNSHPHCVVTYD